MARTYAQLQADVQSRFNRRDVTTQQIQDAINLAIQRAQRLLNVPASEATVDYTWLSTDTKFAIPGDYIKMVNLSVDGGEPLDRVSLSEARRNAFAVGNPGDSPTVLNGIPSQFARDGAFWLIAPVPQTGAVVELVYNNNFPSLVNPTDTNWLSDIAPDAITYGALSDLGMTFADPRRNDGAWGKGWESTFVTVIEDLNNQAMADELTNAQVAPVSHFYDGAYAEEWY
jgi:hypothetical protein